MKRQTYLDTIDHFFFNIKREWGQETLDVITNGILTRIACAKNGRKWDHLKSAVQELVRKQMEDFDVAEMTDWELHFVQVSIEALKGWEEMFDEKG